jgi:hypothetical protein
VEVEGGFSAAPAGINEKLINFTLIMNIAGHPFFMLVSRFHFLGKFVCGQSDNWYIPYLGDALDIVKQIEIAIQRGPQFYRY